MSKQIDKPFLLFAGEQFYPLGGMSDFQSAHDTEIEAMTAAAQIKCDWFQVHDVATGTTRHYNRPP